MSNLPDTANQFGPAYGHRRTASPLRGLSAAYRNRYTTSSDSRHCIVAKRCPPLLGRLAAVLPSRRMHLDDLVGRLCKGRYHRVGRARCGVVAGASDLAVLGCGFACFGKADQRIGAKAQVAALALNHNALYPAPGAAGFDEEEQAR